ncbi:sulfotransferase 1B1-like [Sycon ciliatum]|uniref:sulfotransferase 1B1-like n=1 Tax=Sycon ciliatum TaxID=27933 RepID=UPI0031F6CDC1
MASSITEDPVTPEVEKVIQRVKDSRSKLGTERGKQAAASFQPKPSDVFISSTPKSGTTWMTQICHQLRTGGDMDFGEITEVVPFLECAADLGLNCDDKQRAEPRLYKTHFLEASCPKGGKYITTVRHPYDVAASAYTFLCGWLFEEDELGPNNLLQQITFKSPLPQVVTPANAGSTTLFDHYMGWWPRRHDSDVLFVFYEDMKEDLEREVKRVAEFIGVDDASAVEIALKRSRFDYMFQHREQFNDNLVKKKRNVDMGLSPSAGMQHGKVQTAGGKQHLLNDTTRALLDAAWTRMCLPVTGATDYEEWRRMWRKEQDSAASRRPGDDRDHQHQEEL